jgi:DNA-binding Lrp family transcriptional regulator
MISISPPEWHRRKLSSPRQQETSYRKKVVFVTRGDGEQRALSLIASRPLMAKELRELLNISESTCERLVRRLKSKGLIEQHSFRGEYYIK